MGENRQVWREPTIRLWLQGILRMRMLTHPHPFWATGGCSVPACSPECHQERTHLPALGAILPLSPERSLATPTPLEN